MVGLGPASISDSEALRQLKAAAERQHPSTAVEDFKQIERIWRAGGGAATRVWMATRQFPSIEEAFADWAEWHPDDVKRLGSAAA